MADKKNIFGFTGLARSGKDTATAITLEWLKGEGISAKRVAFADPLKRIFHYLVSSGGKDLEFIEQDYLRDLTIEQKGQTYFLFSQLWRQIEERGLAKQKLGEDNKETYRDLLIKLGVGMRSIEPDFWIVSAFEDELVHEFDGVVVISDVRFQNERDVVGTLIRVVRNGIKPLGGDRGALDESEVFSVVGDFDYVIQNPGYMEGLEKNLYAVFDQMQEPE